MPSETPTQRFPLLQEEKLGLKLCHVCGEPVAPVPIGRPRTYCSVACRRVVEATKRELVGVGSEIREARKLAADDFWPGERWWTVEAQRLELAAAELRQRIPGER